MADCPLHGLPIAHRACPRCEADGVTVCECLLFDAPEIYVMIRKQGGELIAHRSKAILVFRKPLAKIEKSATKTVRDASA